MRIVHLVTIHADAGRAAAMLIMAGLAAILKEKRITWWVAPPDRSGSINIMGRVPQDLPEVPLQDLLRIYSMAPNEVPTPQDEETS